MATLDDYVIDVLMRDLVGHDRKPTSFLIYLWLSTGQFRIGGPVSVSYADIAESVGVSKSSAQVAVAWLLRRKLLAVSKGTVTATPSYTVLKPWKNHANRMERYNN